MFAKIRIVLMVFYAIAPIVALLLAMRRNRLLRLARLMGVAAVASVLSVVVVMLNGWALGGNIAVREVLFLVYVTTSVMLLLGWLGRGVLRLILMALRVRMLPNGIPVASARWRALFGMLLQRAIMLAIIVPYLLVMAMVYRPAMRHRGGVPQMPYCAVNIPASDGVRLSGWWVPAKTPGNLIEDWGQTTVIISPGFARGKESFVARQRNSTTGRTTTQFAETQSAEKKPPPGLVEELAGEGFNVLIYDARGQGESQGHLSGVGDVERRDVLGTIAWVKQNHPNQAQRMFAMGFNTGASSVLAAATEKGSDALDGVVLFEPFARSKNLMKAVSRRTFPGPVGWLMQKCGMPIVSMHLGTDVRKFKPSKLASRVSPGAMLVIHGRGESFVPPLESMEVFRKAMSPKQQYWPSDNYDLRRSRTFASPLDAFKEILREGVGDDAMDMDPGAIHETIEFLRTARKVQIL